MERASGGGRSSSRSGDSSASGRWRRRSSVGGAAGDGNIHSLGADVLCAIFALLDHFDVARCAVVCKSWFAPLPLPSSPSFSSSFGGSVFVREQMTGGSCVKLLSNICETSIVCFYNPIRRCAHLVPIFSTLFCWSIVDGSGGKKDVLQCAEVRMENMISGSNMLTVFKFGGMSYLWKNMLTCINVSPSIIL